MPCTTILIGKKASYDGSTMIARNDDGHFDVKKLVIISSKEQPKKYKSVIGHREIELPENPLAYSACPNVDPKEGKWMAQGINSENVAMSATETISTNALVLGSDPYVRYVAKGKNQKEIIGGIGEEDFLTIVLPYIHSAREGVLRLGALLEKYGTYESNGIAFCDKEECWYMETIGGHHWMALRVDDEEIVIMPNQLGMDRFDFKDALGKKEKYLCSEDMLDFIENSHLVINEDAQKNGFNPRFAFGSHSDSDHVYNTPRGWFMGRYFCPNTYRWDGENAQFNPQSDNIPFALKPERKVTVEDVKYILSSYFQGTPYNPFNKADSPLKGIYRPIGISRTGCMTILQIRGYKPKELQSVEWICFGANPFNVVVPLYTSVQQFPSYFSKVTLDVDSNNFYWISRLIAAMADNNYGDCIQWIERYQFTVAALSHQLLNEYDQKFEKEPDHKLLDKANEDVARMIREEAQKTLGHVLDAASENMICGYKRADH